MSSMMPNEQTEEFNSSVNEFEKNIVITTIKKLMNEHFGIELNYIVILRFFLLKEIINAKIARRIFFLKLLEILSKNFNEFTQQVRK